MTRPIDQLIRELLVAIGEHPEREGLLGTPMRVEKSLRELTRGYDETPQQVVNGAIYQEDYNEMVLSRNVEYFSLCEHHMLPFFGKAHVAYIPGGKILGLSKMARIVDVFARRLQVQERMTQQIAQALAEILEPKGVGVVIEGFHLCMAMRGIEKQHSEMVTSAMIGEFEHNSKTREEFMMLVHGGRR